jgi:hypothetical protein
MSVPNCSEFKLQFAETASEAQAVFAYTYLTPARESKFLASLNSWAN